jgi:hypothetical protein
VIIINSAIVRLDGVNNRLSYSRNR